MTRSVSNGKECHRPTKELKQMSSFQGTGRDLGFIWQKSQHGKNPRENQGAIVICLFHQPPLALPTRLESLFCQPCILPFSKLGDPGGLAVPGPSRPMLPLSWPSCSASNVMPSRCPLLRAPQPPGRARSEGPPVEESVCSFKQPDSRPRALVTAGLGHWHGLNHRGLEVLVLALFVAESSLSQDRISSKGKALFSLSFTESRMGSE